MHSLLKRQLRRYLEDVAIPEELGEFLDAVNLAYEEADEDRAMLERALEISSDELLDANARMRAALEALPDRFVILDQDMTIVECRGGRPEQFKFHPDDVVGAPFSKLDANGQLTALRRAIERSQASRKVESAEYVKEVDGRSEAYEARVFASPEGLVVVIVRNATARRAASEALARQERFLRHVLDLNPTLIFAKDREGRFTMVNKAVADAFGTTVDAMVGKRSRDFDVNAGTADISAADARVIDRREELAIPEKVFTEVSGRTRILQMIKVPVLEPDGSCHNLLGVAVDITNRKIAEEGLRHRTERIVRKHAALEALALAPYDELDDTLERITSVSARALGGVQASLLLFSEDRTVLALEVICPEDGEAERPPEPVGVAADSCPTYLEALRVARVLAIEDLASDPRVSELVASPITGRDARSTLDVPIRVQGKVVGVLRTQSIGRTRTWAIEDQDLVASIGDFASVVLEAGQRRKIEEQLFQSQKMEAIGLLAGGVAHDFNNLLGVILMATDVAAESLDPDHPAAVDLRRVTEAALRAGDLTSKLLAFSRDEVLQHEELDLSRSLYAFAALLSRIMGEDIAVTTSVPDAPLTIKGDRSRIDQVLLNLCTNARQAMPDGGRLDIRLRACSVLDTTARRHGLSAGGHFAELTVADTGSGMSAEVLGRLWEPFYTTKRGGTGLGLAVVYGAVESHQGFVQVDSTEGEGSRFRVYLPLHTVSPESRAESQPTIRGVGEGTVLVAEDEPMLRELLTDGLSGLGYDVVATADGTEAVRRFGDGIGYTAAILDVVMPGMGGAQALAHIRAVSPTLPVLMISGYAPDAAKLADVLEDPLTELLPKPFQVHTLATLLEELVGRAAASLPGPVAAGD